MKFQLLRIYCYVRIFEIRNHYCRLGVTPQTNLKKCFGFRLQTVLLSCMVTNSIGTLLLPKKNFFLATELDVYYCTWKKLYYLIIVLL